MPPQAVFNPAHIMNSAIIQRHLPGNKHVIFPRNAFLRLTVYKFASLPENFSAANFPVLSARGCAFNSSVKIKYLVVAVSPQCSCRLLYVHPRLSSHRVCVSVRARARALMCARGCSTACEFGARWLVPSRDGET